MVVDFYFEVKWIVDMVFFCFEDGCKMFGYSGKVVEILVVIEML